MDELLNKKDEIKQRIQDLKIEKSLGEILGELDNEDLIGNADKEIAILEQQLVEIDKAIENEKKKKEKKAELNSKYPNQKWYYRVLTMSEEELKQWADLELSEKRERKTQLETDKAKIEAQKIELEKRLSGIKEEVKETHNADLLEEAKNMVIEYKAKKHSIEAISKEIEEIGPTEIDLEEFRQGMIGNLKGYIKENDNFEVVKYIEEEQAKGKTLEELAEEITDHMRKRINSDQYSKESELTKIDQIEKEIAAYVIAKTGDYYNIIYYDTDIESYLIMQDFLKEQREIAEKESQEAREEIINKSQMVDSENKISINELEEMFEKGTEPEVKEEGKTY